MNRAEVLAEISKLEGKLSGEMFEDMELKEKIHSLEMKLKDVKPFDGNVIECFGCGS